MNALVLQERIVKSRDRVRAYGEVFTPRHMVDRMLDLVNEDLGTSPEFVDKTFLEPAAGDGNFLVAILQRKLRAVELRFPRDDWAETSLFALASIYGIELLEDNHEAARAAMFDGFQSFHLKHGVSCSADTDLYRAAEFLIDVNIVLGNTLTGLDWNGDEIQFSWWDRVPGAPGVVQRKPFTLASMRSQGFDFTVYKSYAACRIEKVYEGNTAGA